MLLFALAVVSIKIYAVSQPSTIKYNNLQLLFTEDFPEPNTPWTNENKQRFQQLKSMNGKHVHIHIMECVYQMEELKKICPYIEIYQHSYDQRDCNNHGVENGKHGYNVAAVICAEIEGSLATHVHIHNYPRSSMNYFPKLTNEVISQAGKFENNFHIACMSYGVSEPYDLSREIDKLDNAGFLIFAAAGNSANALNMFPSSFHNVIGVGMVQPVIHNSISVNRWVTFSETNGCGTVDKIITHSTLKAATDSSSTIGRHVNIFVPGYLANGFKGTSYAAPRAAAILAKVLGLFTAKYGDYLKIPNVRDNIISMFKSQGEWPKDNSMKLTPIWRNLVKPGVCCLKFREGGCETTEYYLSTSSDKINNIVEEIYDKVFLMM